MMETLLNKSSDAINAALRHDWQSWSALMTLQGKSLRLEISDWSVRVLCQFSDQGLVLSVASDDESADCVLMGSSLQLLQMLWRESSTLPEGMRLRGDTSIAQVLQNIMKNTNIDWPAVMSPLFGDAMATSVVGGGQWIKTWLQTQAHHRGSDLRDVMQDEWQHLPHPAEVETLFHDIAVLRDDVARVQATFHRMMEKRKEPVTC